MFRTIAVVALTVTAALTLTACGEDPGPPGTANGGCAATTSLGAVSGTTGSGVCAFRGIPYAAPPTGARRFRPPQPVRPWRGTLAATDRTRVCPQGRDQLSEDYPDDRAEYTDEDCLYLNVWTPRPDRRKRPVIVFIHGGAARFGTGNEPRYDGSTLAARGDAVVVNLNYRLGVLGWTELGGLDPAYRGSGNNGLRDQIQALRWVHEHVADFGGDPANITAVGQSEGAFSLSAMLATDHPERLFRRVVLESGSGALVHSAGYERTLADAFPVRRLADLTAMSTTDVLQLQERLISAAPGVGGSVYFGPYVDGTLVRGAVTDRVAAGNARHVDLLVGSTRDEMNFFGQFGDDGLDQVAGQYDGFFPPALAARRESMEATYRRDLPGENVALAMFTDQGFRVPASRLAEAQSRWRPTYVYEFGWRPPAGVGAVHTIELPFVFGTLRFRGVQGGDEALASSRPQLAALSAQMVDAWTSFARTGDPNARRTVARPRWPAYRAPRRSVLNWDLTPAVIDAPREAERAAWDGYPFGPFGS